jgi:hypothetical protein
LSCGFAELEVLKAGAQQRIAARRLELNLGLDGPGSSGLLSTTSRKMSHLVDARPAESDNTAAASKTVNSATSAPSFIAQNRRTG